MSTEKLPAVVENLFKTTDAVIWAHEWALIARNNGLRDIDEEWMVTWFANAIEVAKAHERRRICGDPMRHPFMRIALKPHDQKSDADKALIAAIVLLSTQHDPQAVSRSFSHLTMEEAFEKLVKQHDEMISWDKGSWHRL